MAMAMTRMMDDDEEEDEEEDGDDVPPETLHFSRHPLVDLLLCPCVLRRGGFRLWVLAGWACRVLRLGPEGGGGMRKEAGPILPLGDSAGPWGL
eukprot:2924344-Pyramimonas_sp.AAC.1